MLYKRILLFIFAFLSFPILMNAQVTTGSITGSVKDSQGKDLPGATVEVIHVPSGSIYRASSGKSGVFNIPSLRVGGPYTLSITYVGFKKETITDVNVQLGEPSRVDVVLTDANTNLTEVVISATGKRGSLISKDRKGTSTNINRRLITALPTLSRNITDFTKLTPQASGTSFAGQDNRFINLTVDGSIFNNSFGLQALPGSQTSASPISIDAIEEIQVNVSPYSVRDAGFTGASINAVTRSGTNTFHGSVFYNNRNPKLTGTKAGLDGKTSVTILDFDVKQYGASLGGPIIKNKLFFFANFEEEKRTDPGTAFLSDNGTNSGQANVSRVKQSDLDALSSFLNTKLSYDPGDYQGYSFLTGSKKALAKIDWNINTKNKFSLRANYLKSNKDIGASGSGSFAGGRQSSLNTMNFSNNNYTIHNDIYSLIGQVNTRFTNKISNELIFGYTANRDYREIKGSLFPSVDILDGSGTDKNLISFGTEIFTPNNKLNTDTWQVSDNVTFYSGKHTISAGANFESFKFFNQFTPRIQGLFVFNNLADFYTSANAYLGNPNMTQNPVNLRRYLLDYSNLPDHELYNAVTKAANIGTYLQDEWQIQDNLNLTMGIRLDVPFFPKGNALENQQVNSYTFVDELGNPKKLSTSRLPSTKVMISPRFGFNKDINGDKETQIRGGVGLFAGRPAFVFISNAVGNNGLQSGGISFDNTNVYPFSPDITRNIPTNLVPGTPAPKYGIAPIEKEFRFPQVFRTNLAIDQKLFSGIVGSIEGLLTQSLSNIFYYNANQKPSTSTFSGPDNRPRFAGSSSAVRINPNINEAPVLASRPYGANTTLTFKIEKQLRKNFSWLLAYNYSITKDYLSAGSIAFSSFTSTRTVNGNNLPDYSFSDNDLRNRIIGNITYRKEIAKTAALQISLYGQAQNQGRISYGYSGDMNLDGITGNDLLYIPKDNSPFEMNFEPYPITLIINGVTTNTTFTAAQQRSAFDAFIQQDKYLRNHRGEVAKRNGALQPILTKFDLSAMLELFKNFGKQRHTIQFRADIFNVGNFINHKWGVSDVVNTTTPVAARPPASTAPNVPLFRYNVINNSTDYTTYRKGTSIFDVYQAQLGIRYIF